MTQWPWRQHAGDRVDAVPAGLQEQAVLIDRGHVVPNADRNVLTARPINQATFLMSNMLAQAPDNNQGPWSAFETYLGGLAQSQNREVYIIAGASGSSWRSVLTNRSMRERLS